MTVRDRRGRVVGSNPVDFCPNGARQRLNGDGPTLSRYPELEGCFAGPRCLCYGISMVNRRGRSVLNFSSTSWNAGPAPLVIEGFRRRGNAIMDAYQYFHDAEGQPVGRTPVGTMKYHSDGGHNHWHLLQFAQDDLLDASKRTSLRGRKQAFCLVPTDAVDLTLPGATWATGPMDLGSSCGEPSSIWIRETLPAGWGDTHPAPASTTSPSTSQACATVATTCAFGSTRLGPSTSARRATTSRHARSASPASAASGASSYTRGRGSGSKGPSNPKAGRPLSVDRSSRSHRRRAGRRTVALNHSDRRGGAPRPRSRGGRTARPRP